MIFVLTFCDLCLFSHTNAQREKTCDWSAREWECAADRARVVAGAGMAGAGGEAQWVVATIAGGNGMVHWESH
jgi:hypothetical protein